MDYFVSKLRLRPFLRGLCDGTAYRFRLETRDHRVEMIISNIKGEDLITFVLDRIALKLTVSLPLNNRTTDLPSVSGWWKRSYPDEITYERRLDGITVIRDVKQFIITLVQAIQVRDLRDLLNRLEEGSEL